MIRIDTVKELRKAWNHIMVTLRRDLGAAARLAADPVATLESLGYQVGDEAAVALRRAIP